MKSVTPTVLRVLVSLVAVVATVGQVAYLDALAWHTLGLTMPMSAQMSPAFLTLMTAHAVVSVVSAGLAVALVLHEGPRQAAARGLGLALGAWSYLMAYSGVTLLLRPDPGIFRAAFEGHFLLVEMAGLVGLLRFTALFPRPLRDQALPAPPSLPRVVMPFHRASVWMLRPAAPWLVGSGVLVALWSSTLAGGHPIGDAGLSPAMDVVRFSAAGLVVLNLRRSWGRATPDVEDRLGWLLAALVFLLGALLLFIGGNVLMAVTAWREPAIAWRPVLMDIGVLGFLVGLAMAVLYEGALDATRTAHRIAALSTVVASGLFLAAGLEALFSRGVLAGVRTGVGTVIALAIVVSTHRGMVRSLERVFRQLPGPGVGVIGGVRG